MSDDTDGRVRSNKQILVDALNAFGRNPDPARLRGVLDSSPDLAAVLTSLLPSIELPAHDRNYLEASPEYSAVFRALLEMTARLELPFQVELAMNEDTGFSVEVDESHARLTIRTWPDEPLGPI